MRIEMQVSNGSANFITQNEQDTIEQVIALLKNPDVVSITIRKQILNRKDKHHGNVDY